MRKIKYKIAENKEIQTRVIFSNYLRNTQFNFAKQTDMLGDLRPFAYLSNISAQPSSLALKAIPN